MRTLILAAILITLSPVANADLGVIEITPEEASRLSPGLAGPPAILPSNANTTISGEIGYNMDSEDSIVYLFEIPQNSETESKSLVEISLTLIKTDVDMYLYNKSLTEINSSIEPENSDERIRATLTPGIYAVKLYNTSADTVSPYQLDISTKPAPEFKITIDDPGSNHSNAHDLGELNEGSALRVNQKITSDDSDAFKVKLPKTYSWPTNIKVTLFTESVDGLPDDMVIEIYEANAGLLATVDESASSKEQKIVRVDPGEFIFVVRGFSDMDLANYELSVEIAPQ